MFAIERLVQGVMPMGRDVVLGLEDDYSAGLWFSKEIASAVVHRCTRIRATRHRDL